MDEIISKILHKKASCVNDPVQATILEEELSKKLEDMLSEDGVKIFEKLENVQYDTYLERVKLAYKEGFKDAVCIMEKLNNK